MINANNITEATPHDTRDVSSPAAAKQHTIPVYRVDPRGGAIAAFRALHSITLARAAARVGLDPRILAGLESGTMKTDDLTWAKIGAEIRALASE